MRDFSTFDQCSRDYSALDSKALATIEATISELSTLHTVYSTAADTASGCANADDIYKNRDTAEAFLARLESTQFTLMASAAVRLGAA